MHLACSVGTTASVILSILPQIIAESLLGAWWCW